MKLTDAIFHVLQSETNAKTVEDLVDGGAGTLSAVLHARSDMPPTRRFMQKMLRTAAYHRTCSGKAKV
ncbi:MAG: hypothetical protein ACLUOF_06760 [Ruminococcus sp.]